LVALDLFQVSNESVDRINNVGIGADPWIGKQSKNSALRPSQDTFGFINCAWSSTNYLLSTISVPIGSLSFKITGHDARHHATLPASQVNVEQLTALHKRAA